eukprot:2187712-Rhodomonas_salina.2
MVVPGSCEGVSAHSPWCATLSAYATFLHYFPTLHAYATRLHYLPMLSAYAILPACDEMRCTERGSNAMRGTETARDTRGCVSS